VWAVQVAYNEKTIGDFVMLKWDPALYGRSLLRMADLTDEEMEYLKANFNAGDILL